MDTATAIIMNTVLKETCVGTHGCTGRKTTIKGCGEVVNMGEKLTAKIKWIVLKKIAQKITGREVNIHCSTALEDNIKAAVTFNDDRADVAINLSHAKSVKDVIAAISHELAHITSGHINDDEVHRPEWVRIEEEITRRYREGRVNDANNNS